MSRAYRKYLDEQLWRSTQEYAAQRLGKSLRSIRRYERRRSEEQSSGAFAAEVGQKHLFIPDSQVTPWSDQRVLDWIGEYASEKQPDVIVHAGDFADMESLSSYDKGKKAFEGRSYAADIKAAREGIERLTKAIHSPPGYQPRLVLTLGNHEARIDRAVEQQRELEGLISTDDLGYAEAGWQAIPFLEPINIAGVSYAHYFTNNMTGRPLGGFAHTRLKTVGHSFSMGHQQTLDLATRFLPDGSQQCALIAGASYIEHFKYLGPQGNQHWRGIVMKYGVKNGGYDHRVVSIGSLCHRYEGISLFEYMRREGSK